MKLKNIVMAGIALVASLAFTSCQTEWPDTNPINLEGVNVVAYGPNPVARGGQLRFVGTGLDQITTVVMPGAGEVTEIEHVSANDIRIVVPQTAEFGYISLKDGKGNVYECEKRLTFTEPVAFAAENAFAPNPVKAGQELTIKGDYLNLVQAIVFTDGVKVSEMKKHTREEIVVVVPAEAKTGKVTLWFCATEDTIANEVASKEKLEVILPSVAEITEMEEKKPGDEITIEGKDFDLITALYGTDGEPLEFEATATSITFTLPEVVVNGVINVETASGVKVTIATIGVALPKVTAVAGNTDVRAESVVTITGTDFEIAEKVTFSAANGKTVEAALESQSATELTVKVPAAAISGEFAINTTAGVDVKAELLTIETQKPAFASFEPAEAPMGARVNMLGENMDLVVKVTLTGGAVLEATTVDGDSASFVLPYANAETGKVTLMMANGETVETSASLTVNPPLCCYVVAWPELVDDEPIQAGTLLCIEVENRDSLTNVEIDGIDCQFILNGANRVYIDIPETAGKKSHVKLISTCGEIDYAYAFKPNSEIVSILWKGALEVSQDYFLTDGGDEFVAANVQVGDILTFFVTVTDEGEWYFEAGEGHWTKPDGENWLVYGHWETGDDISTGKFTIVVTQEILDYALTKGWWGGIFVLQGKNVILSKVTNTHKIATEKTLWSGSVTAAEQPYLLSDAGAELVENEVEVGNVLYFYISTEAEYDFQIGEGHWTKPDGENWLTYGAWKSPDNDADVAGGRIEIVVTEEILNYALTQCWWGGVFVLNGSGVTLTKITVLN